MYAILANPYSRFVSSNRPSLPPVTIITKSHYTPKSYAHKGPTPWLCLSICPAKLLSPLPANLPQPSKEKLSPAPRISVYSRSGRSYNI